MNTNSNWVDITQWMDSLVDFIKSKDLVLFVGAGISKNPPSNLPLANELRSFILEKISGKNKEIREFYEENLKEEHEVGKKIFDYPLEGFFQILFHNSENFLKSLTKTFKYGNPNANHYLIAKLVKKGYIARVLTTNFDLLLERALEKEEMKRDVNFKVLYSEKQFLDLDFEKLDIPTIFKIHGTADVEYSIRFTLDLVASRVLSEARAKILRYFFKDVGGVLVLGYNAGDEFDINLVIQTTASESVIFFVNHNKEQLEISQLSRPFKNFRGIKVTCDTDRIIEHLGTVFAEGELKPKDRETSNAWRIPIHKWSETLDSGTRFYLIARILREILELDKALPLFKRSLQHLARTHNLRSMSIVLENLAFIEQTKSNYGQAEKLLDECLANYNKLGDQNAIANVIHEKATLKQFQGNYGESLNLYNQCIVLRRSIEDWTGLAQTLNQLGSLQSAQGNYEEALRLFYRSVEIKRELGDPKGIAKTLHNIASIRQIQGYLDEANKLYNQSKQIFERLCDPEAIANTLHHLGIIQQLKRNYPAAIKLYYQALHIDKKLGNHRGIARTLHQLGSMRQSKGDYDEAIRLFNQSLNIKQQVGDLEGIAKTINNIAVIRQFQGDYHEARRLYNQSLEIKRKLNDLEGIASTYWGLGHLSELQGKIEEAIEYYGRASEIFEKLEIMPQAQLAILDLQKAIKKMSKY